MEKSNEIEPPKQQENPTSVCVYQIWEFLYGHKIHEHAFINQNRVGTNKLPSIDIQRIYIWNNEGIFLYLKSQTE